MCNVPFLVTSHQTKTKSTQQMSQQKLCPITLQQYTHVTRLSGWNVLQEESSDLTWKMSLCLPEVCLNAKMSSQKTEAWKSNIASVCCVQNIGRLLTSKQKGGFKNGVLSSLHCIWFTCYCGILSCCIDNSAGKVKLISSSSVFTSSCICVINVLSFKDFKYDNEMWWINLYRHRLVFVG